MKVEMYTLLTLIGFGITIAIFIIKIWDNNAKFNKEQTKDAEEFRIDQVRQYTEFQTTTNLRIANLEKEYAQLAESIVTNRNDILGTYQRYKDETVGHTLEFRSETKEALSDNKLEHGELKTALLNVSKSVEFIKGKLSTAKERKDFDEKQT
jgi:hypothetical protein